MMSLDFQTFQLHCGLEIDLASNRNISGVKSRRLINLPSLVL
jgi:hypothetical protein